MLIYKRVKVGDSGVKRTCKKNKNKINNPLKYINKTIQIYMGGWERKKEIQQWEYTLKTKK
jgi:hypothetical protein